MSPSGELFDSIGEHADTIEDISKEVKDKYWANRKAGVSMPSGMRGVAVSMGWTRLTVGYTLMVDTSSEDAATVAIEKLPPEMLVGRSQVYVELPDFSTIEVPVREGEDALDAWKHRTDIHHRVTASPYITAPRIAVDFDGTLTTDCDKAGNKAVWPAIGEPMPETIARVRELADRGWQIIIHTCRTSPLGDGPHSPMDRLIEVRQWLDDNGVPFHEIWPFPKPHADIYLDDHGLNVTDFQKYGIVGKEPEKPAGPGRFFTEAELLSLPKPPLEAAADTDDSVYLMAKLPVGDGGIGDDILAWGQKFVPDDQVYHNPDDTDLMTRYGREEDPHITVVFGLRSPEGTEVIKDFLPQKSMTATLGRVSVFSNPQDPFDTLKVDVNSPDLVELNAALRQAFEVDDTFPNYTPHVTIAYIKKGACKELLNSEPFAGKKVVLPSIDCMDCGSPVTIFEHKPAADVQASLIDYPHQGLPSDLWAQTETGWQMLPEARTGITSAVMNLLESAGFRDCSAWVKALYMQGSSATQFYTKHTDIDVQVLINLDQFMDHNPLASLAPVGIEGVVIDYLNEILEKLDKTAKFGDRPLEARLRLESEKADKKFMLETDAIYDITGQTWIKQMPEVKYLTYSRKSVIGPALETALAQAEQWDAQLGQVHRTLNELQLLADYLTTEPGEAKRDYSKYRSLLLRRTAALIDKMKRRRKRIRGLRSTAFRRRDQAWHGVVNAHPDVVLNKLLLDWGYFQKILNLAHYLKAKAGALELDDVSPLLLILDGRPQPQVPPAPGGLIPASLKWQAYLKTLPLALKAGGDIAELLSWLEDSGFEVSTRYGGGAEALPDPKTMCGGDCEGTGYVPVNFREPSPGQAYFVYSDEDDRLYHDPWDAAEAADPSEDGYHFLPCPQCGGTGKKPATEVILEAIGEAASLHWPASGEVFDAEGAQRIAEILREQLGIDAAGGDINSPEFKAWFAGSKVVDGSGNPLVLKHGSHTEGIETFHGLTTVVPGLTFFTDNAPTAKSYGKVLYGVCLKMENPLIVDAGGAKFGDADNSHPLSVAETAKEEGYDGAIVRNIKDGMNYKDLGSTYMVWDPDQVWKVSESGKDKSGRKAEDLATRQKRVADDAERDKKDQEDRMRETQAWLQTPAGKKYESDKAALQKKRDVDSETKTLQAAGITAANLRLSLRADQEVDIETLSPASIQEIADQIETHFPDVVEEGWSSTAIAEFLKQGVVGIAKVKLGETDPNYLKDQFDSFRKVSKTAVKKYTKMVKDGTHFDPVVLKNGDFLDGGHRVEAYIAAGSDSIPTMDIGAILKEDWFDILVGSGAGDKYGVKADDFSGLQKAARALVEQDPKWTGYLTNPAVAQGLGAVQSAVDRCRSTDDLRKVWEQFRPAITWEQVEARAKEKPKTAAALRPILFNR